MNFKFAPNLFLEVLELEIFKKSLDEKGFRKNILENTESFGLIQNKKADPSFLNGKVSRDFDSTLGQKTLKISPTLGIDRNGQFIFQEQKNLITVPNDGNWYWVKIAHIYSSIEVGTFSISSNGTITGSVDSRLTQILRGQPNFPSRIRFTNSTHNTLEYDVLEIVNDQNAIIQHPALTSGGVVAFVAETDLKLEVIGTFTPGIAIPSGEKRPFQYDSCTLSLVVETSNNIRPVHTVDIDFFLARVKVQGDDLIVQDKRINYWETKGSQKAVEIERANNPLIGVENIKWDSIITPSESNILELAWGMRSQNWSVDSSRNLITLQGSATGGKYKTINDFVDGDFNGWRIYTDNGRYSRVVSSIKQGLAINLTLDVLDIDNYSLDGGLSFTATSWLLVVPDIDTVIIKAIPHVPDLQSFMEKEFSFPVNTLLAKLKLTVYLDPEVFYNLQYRYQSSKEFTPFTVIPSDEESGYFTETSFDDNGNFKQPSDRVKYPYINDNTNGFIKLIMSPFAYIRTINFISKGDLIGVNTITTLADTLYQLRVGIDKNYQHLVGSINIANDVRFNLSKIDAIEGNEFRFHIDCSILTVGTKTIFFTQENILEDDSIEVITLKTVSRVDINQMYNQDGGLVFDFVFDDQGKWIVYQNYANGLLGEIKTMDGVIDDLVDSNGWGKVKGLFGFSICDSRNTTPNLVERFLLGSGTSVTPAIVVEPGNYDGEKEVILTKAQLPAESLKMFSDEDQGDTTGNKIQDFPNKVVPWTSSGNVSADLDVRMAAGDLDEPTLGITSPMGEGEAHENMPPYYAVIYFKRIY